MKTNRQHCKELEDNVKKKEAECDKIQKQLELLDESKPNPEIIALQIKLTFARNEASNANIKYRDFKAFIPEEKMNEKYKGG
jgi:hypothetical protein